MLRHLADPPLGLFVRGELPAASMVAIVGSRRATGYGRQVARMLGEEMARAGVAVVSGMAVGVDTAAHEGALSGKGLTVAVWGTGPDQVYPAENRRLAEEIAGQGALVTEYPPGTPPRRHHFPERNRVIAGMARAVVIVEAAARSGALITARLALEEGREVLAVPGSIFSELSLGPNALLRMGARPLLTPRDLLEELSSAASVADNSRAEPGSAEADDGLLRFLPRGETISVDDLANRAELPVTEILPELLELELTARVERLDDGRYCRR
jgi:DNA processing protein